MRLSHTMTKIRWFGPLSVLLLLCQQCTPTLPTNEAPGGETNKEARTESLFEPPPTRQEAITGTDSGGQESPPQEPTPPDNTPDQSSVGDAPVEPGPTEPPVAPDTAPTPDMVSPPDQPPTPQGYCPTLAAPTGNIIRVKPTDASKLPSIVDQAPAGSTILLANGTYKMQGNESQRRIRIRKANLTLRSASGDPTKVIIDGNYQTNEAISVEADNFTIADITLTRVRHHLLHVTGQNNQHNKGMKVYNVHFIDAAQQFIKANGRTNSTTKKRYFADDVEVACSTFTLTATGRKKVEQRISGANLGCYTGGIDTHSGWKWVVRDNTFEGLYCTNGSISEHAIHFWQQSRDTTIERNVMINCARGIGLGLTAKDNTRDYTDDPTQGISGYVGHIGALVRNNVIHVDSAANVAKWCDTGIELAQAINIKLYHNTIARHTFSALDARYTNTKDADIRNNVYWGRITKRNGGTTKEAKNVGNPPAASFVNAGKGNYRLRQSASQLIDKGVVIKDAGRDIDGTPRNLGSGPDIGAFEYKP